MTLNKMKRFLYIIFFVWFSSTIRAQEVLPKPNPPRLVVDNANILSPDQQQIFEQKLAAFND